MIVIKLNVHSIYGYCAVVCENEPMPVKDDGRLDFDMLKRDILSFDTAYIVDIGNGIDMVVDDEALLKDNPHPNWIATALRTLYWAKSKNIAVPSNYPPVCGSVALLGHDDEGNLVDLNDEQVNYINSLVR